jgi:hypothetical protein
VDSSGMESSGTEGIWGREPENNEERQTNNEERCERLVSQQEKVCES